MDGPRGCWWVGGWVLGSERLLQLQLQRIVGAAPRSTTAFSAVANRFYKHFPHYSVPSLCVKRRSKAHPFGTAHFPPRKASLMWMVGGGIQVPE